MTGFASWQTFGAPTPQYAQASPNLRLLATYLGERYQLRNLGIYNRRPIRGGTAWSSHAFGAALDAFCEAVMHDVDFQFSDEAVDESILANGYEFDENGGLE